MKDNNEMQAEDSVPDLKLLINCRKIHEPCFPYFGTVYMTLLGVMQGIVFAATIVPTVSFLEGFKYDWLLCFSVLLFSIVLWHKYANHHQIIGWQLGPFDTINIAFFGLLQTIMVINVNKNYQVMIEGNYTFSEVVFYKQTIYFIFTILCSVSLGVISYAHSGSEVCKSYVKNVIIEHYNTCSKCNNGRNHCIYDPADLYQFLVGFEAICLIGAIETCLYMVVNLTILSVLIKIFNNYIIILSIIMYILITFYFVINFEFKREITSSKKMHRTLKLGKFIVSNENKEKLWFWLFVIPRYFFCSFSHFSNIKKIVSVKRKKIVQINQVKR